MTVMFQRLLQVLSRAIASTFIDLAFTFAVIRCFLAALLDKSGFLSFRCHKLQGFTWSEAWFSTNERGLACFSHCDWRL